MKKAFFFILAACLPLLSVQAKELPNEVEADSIILQLQEIEVVAARATSNTPVAYSDISKKEIKENNFGKDIPFLLSLSPSVVATSEAGTGMGYTGFRIRGTDANRINITTNGIPINDAESQGVFWVNMPDFASSLEDLQVQRGVGTSSNGSAAFGASINMKTEHIASESYGEFNGGYGSFGTSKATLKLGTGDIANHFAFDARLSSLQSDGFIDRASVDLKSYFFQGAYYNDNTLIKFITFGGKEKTYHAWDGVPDYILFPTDGTKPNRKYNLLGYMGVDENGKTLYYKDQTDNYIQTHYHLSLLQLLSNALKLNVSLHYTKGDGYYEQYKGSESLYEYLLNNYESEGQIIKKSDLVREKHLKNDFYGGIFSLDYTAKKWNATLGGSANYYDGDHFGYVTWVKGYAGDAAFYPNHEYYRSVGQKLDLNIYLKGNYQPTKQLNLYADLQYRYIDYKIKGTNDNWDWVNDCPEQLNFHPTFSFFNPKAGVFYQINKENEVYGSVAVAHREPNRNNYTDAVTDVPARSERLIDYELGYKFHNSQFLAGVNLYYMDYKDQLILNGTVNEIREPLTVNIPKSYRMGMEFIFGARITRWLKWDGNLTLSQNKIKNHTEHYTVYDSSWTEEAEQATEHYKKTTIAYSPSVIANSLFTVSHKSFSAGLQSSYVGKQYFDNTENKDKSLDSYFVNNLSLGYQFKLKGVKELSLGVIIYNLFNEKYENNGYGWSYYMRQADGSKELINERFYFPQAGTNLMTNITLKF